MSYHERKKVEKTFIDIQPNFKMDNQKLELDENQEMLNGLTDILSFLTLGKYMPLSTVVYITMATVSFYQLSYFNIYFTPNTSYGKLKKY